MAVSEDCKLVTDWMREPDHAEKFTSNDLNAWLDRRPVAEVARLTAALSDQVAVPNVWISVKDRLPELDQVVAVCYPSGSDGFPQYAWGARLDEGDGWLWGLRCGYGGVRSDKDASWNGVEADDDYPVTHWQPLPAPPSVPASTPVRSS